jgi:hypothetical protein
MRAQLLLAAVLCLAFSQRGVAQTETAGDPSAGGLVSGDYIRVSAGLAHPLDAQGSLRDWKPGESFGLSYENWMPGNGGNGVGQFGFGIGLVYNALPFDSQTFMADFIPASGGAITSASASHARVLEITSTIRYRFPMPVIAPAINVGFGFLNWAPSKISYVTAEGTTTAQQQHRSGFEVSVGGSVDRQLYDRFALFGEAAYVYGFTRYGAFTTPNGSCARNNCDVLKNTTLGTIRGGLRVRMGR